MVQLAGREDQIQRRAQASVFFHALKDRVVAPREISLESHDTQLFNFPNGLGTIRGAAFVHFAIRAVVSREIDEDGVARQDSLGHGLFRPDFPWQFLVARVGPRGRAALACR